MLSGRHTVAVTTAASERRPARAWRGLLLVTLAGVVWGTIGPGVHLVHQRSGLSPLTISAYRAVAGAGVLLLAALVTGRIRSTWSLARSQWRRVLAVGVLTATFQLLYFVAVIATGVSVATVVCLGFAPVLLLVLDSVQRRRLPPLTRVFTVAIAVAGLLLVSLIGGGAEQAAHPTLGVLLALGSGGAYALAADIAAPLTQRLDTLTVTVATITVAAVVLVPVGLIATFVRGDGFAVGDPASWALIGYLGVITMAVAYALMYTGLRTTPSGTAVLATLIEPVTAVLIAVAFLGEQLSGAGVVGSLLVVTAIASLGRQAGEPAPQ